eukprot:COSAG06_NODE_28_length_32009_cov_31.553463_6_plen_64_part_00
MQLVRALRWLAQPDLLLTAAQERVRSTTRQSAISFTEQPEPEAGAIQLSAAGCPSIMATAAAD